MKRIIFLIILCVITIVAKAQTYYSNKVDLLYWDNTYETWQLKHTENKLSEFVFSKGKSYFVHQTSELTCFYEILKTIDYLDDGTPIFIIKSNANNYYYLVMKEDYFSFTWNDEHGNLIMTSWFIYFYKN